MMHLRGKLWKKVMGAVGATLAAALLLPAAAFGAEEQAVPPMVKAAGETTRIQATSGDGYDHIYTIGTMSGVMISWYIDSLAEGSSARFDLGGDVVLPSGGIELAKDGVTIAFRAGNGTRASMIPAAGTDRLFNVRAQGVTMTLENVWLDSARTTGGGVRVFEGASLTLTGNGAASSGFVGSGATVVEYGGALQVEGTLEASGIGVSGYTALAGGGALYVAEGGEAVLTDVKLVGNLAGTAGGGAYVDGQLLACDTAINENSASALGGGVYVGRGEFTLESGELWKNIVTNTTGAPAYGGGVYVDTGAFLMKGGQIYGHNVSSGRNGEPGRGGGVYVQDGLFLMEGGKVGAASASNPNTTTQRNGATQGAGVFVANGIFATRAADENDPPAVQSNSASEDGAGVYVSDGVLDIDGGSFDFNWAASGAGSNIHLEIGVVEREFGGIVYTQGIRNAMIANGRASTTTSGGGGLFVLQKQGEDIDLLGGTMFSKNVSLGTGGAVHFEAAGAGLGRVGSLGGNVFTGNYAPWGGAVYLRNADVALGDDRIEGNRNSPNTPAVMLGVSMDFGYGAGVYMENSALVLDGTSVTGNTGARFGSGIYVDDGSRLESNGGQISTNVAKAEEGGAGVYLNGGEARFTGTEIGGNKTERGSGAGLYVTSGGEATLDDGTRVTDNTIAAANDGKGNGNGNGAGIYIDSGTLRLLDVEISGNRAEPGANGLTGGSLGGGIYVAGTAALVLDTATIQENYALHGGGIYYDVDGAMSLGGGVHIEGNEALEAGGGIYHAQGSEVLLGGAVLKDNTAGTAGGGIVVYSDKVVVTMTCGEISGNTAPNGGGVGLATGSFTMTSGRFSGNVSSAYGGGIGAAAGTDVALQAAAVGDIVLENNEAARQGGAVYIQEGATFASENVVYTGNKATLAGGGVYLGSGGRVAGGSFEDGRAEDGGALYVPFGATVQVAGVEFTGNEAARDGGAIAVSAGAEATVSGSTFTENKAEGEEETTGAHGGGAIRSLGVLDLQGSTFVGNEATGLSGGAVYSRLNDLSGAGGSGEQKIAGNELTGNSAAQDGGGLYMFIEEGGVNEDFSCNIFDGNHAGRNGGGAFVYYYGKGNKVYGNVVKNNSAGANGGGVYIEGDLGQYFGMTNDRVVNNRAGENGGGVYVNGTIFYMMDAEDLGDPVISGNWAGQDGGGVYAAGTGKLVVEAGSLDDNNAGRHGGAVYTHATLSGDAALEGELAKYKGVLVTLAPADPDKTISVSGNTAGYEKPEDDLIDGALVTGNGGAIYVAQDGLLEVEGTVLNGNSADNGGALYIAQDGELRVGRAGAVGGVELTGNEAAADGGAIYVGSGVVEMYGADVQGNEAGGSGGGAYIRIASDNGSGVGRAQAISGNTFEGNRAADGGGVYIYITGTGISNRIDGNIVRGNEASGSGGGAYVRMEGAGRAIYGNLFEDNEATYGGGLFVTGTGLVEGTVQNRMALSNDRVVDNRAEYGGGVFVDGNSEFMLFDAENAGRHTLDDDGEETADLIEGVPLFERNEARVAGGALYVSEAAGVTVQAGEFVTNTARYAGGGVFLAATADWKTGFLPGDSRTVLFKGNRAEPEGTADYGVNRTAGGAFYATPNKAAGHELVFEAAGDSGYVFRDNYAEEGGAIYVPLDSLASLRLADVAFSGNKADAAVMADDVTDTHKQLHDSGQVNWPTSAKALSEYAAGAEFEYAYNNYDVAYFANSYRVYFHANGGAITSQTLAGVPDYFVTLEADETLGQFGVPVPKSDDPNTPDPETWIEREGFAFIGWYAEADMDAAGTLVETAVELDQIVGSAAGSDAQVVNLYAAWLPVPEFVADELGNSVYISDDVVRGTAVAGAQGDEVEVYVYFGDAGPEKADVEQDGTWSAARPVGVTLEKGMVISALQVIKTADNDTVTSGRAETVVAEGYTLTYSENGAMTGTVPEAVRGIKPGERVKVYDPAGDLMRIQYAFMGWSLDSGLYGPGTVTYEEGDELPITEDTVLYASWQRLSGVYYTAPDADDPAKVPDMTEPLPVGEEVEVCFETDELPKREGYRFTGWRAMDTEGKIYWLDPDGPTQTLELGNDVLELTAVWEPLYRVRYSPNGSQTRIEQVGDFPDASKWVAIGDDVKLPEKSELSTVTRTGYEMKGWALTQTGTVDTMYEFGETYKVAAKDANTDRTVWMYLVWEQLTSAAPEIDPITEGDTAISGRGIQGSEVLVYLPGGGYEGTTVLDGGVWQIKVPWNIELLAGQAVRAVQTQPGYKPSGETKEIVGERSPVPAFGLVYEADGTVTGTGEPGGKVTVTFKQGDSVDTTVEGDGSWQVDVPAGYILAKGDVIYAVQEVDGLPVSDKAETTVLEKGTAPMPVIDLLYAGKTEVTGVNALPGATVTVRWPSGDTSLVPSEEINPFGLWRIDVPQAEVLAEGDVLYAMQARDGLFDSAWAEQVVLGLTPAPAIEPVTEGDAVVYGGGGVPGARLTLTWPWGDGETSTVLIGAEDGRWQLDVPAGHSLEPGAVLYAAQQEAGRPMSERGETTVQALPVAPAPTIAEVIAGDRTVSGGGGVAGGLVTVTGPDGRSRAVRLGEDTDGSWTIAVPEGIELFAGDVLWATQDLAGHKQSERAETTVQPRVPTVKTPAPVIDEAQEGDLWVTGTGEPGAVLTLVWPWGDPAETVTLTVPENGHWAARVPDGKVLAQGDRLAATQVLEGYLPSDEVAMIVTAAPVVDETRPPHFWEVYDDAAIVYGDHALAGATIAVTWPGGMETDIEIPIDTDGTWQIVVPDGVTLMAGDVLRAVQTLLGNLPSEEATTTVLERQTTPAPEIAVAYEWDRTVHGTGVARARLTLSWPWQDATDTVVTVDADGGWSARVPDGYALLERDVLYAVQQETDKLVSSAAAMTVVKREQTPEPAIDLAYEGDGMVQGRGVAGAVLTLHWPWQGALDEILTVDLDGSWSVHVPDSYTLREGETVHAEQQETDKLPSDVAAMTVVKRDQTPAPEIAESYEGDTVVRGRGVPGAALTLRWPWQDVVDVVITVDADGSWSVRVPDGYVLRESDTLSAVQQETGKLVSEAATAVVGKDQSGSSTPSDKDPGSSSSAVAGSSSGGGGQSSSPATGASSETGRGQSSSRPVASGTGPDGPGEVPSEGDGGGGAGGTDEGGVGSSSSRGAASSRPVVATTSRPTASSGVASSTTGASSEVVSSGSASSEQGGASGADSSEATSADSAVDSTDTSEPGGSGGAGSGFAQLWEDLFGDSVPLGGMRFTGGWSLLNLILALLALIVAVLVLVFTVLKKRGMAMGTAGVLRWLAIVLGVALPVLFLLFEDMGLPVVLLDQFTPLMLVLLAAQLAVLVLYKVLRPRADGQG